MRIASTALFVCTCAAHGQGFGQLATNRDGSTLYFSSPFRMKGTNQYLHPKIFVWDKTKGISLYEQRPSDLPYPSDVSYTAPFFSFIGKEFFALTNPDVTSDGATVALTGNRFCNFSDVCVVGLEEYHSTIYLPGQRAMDLVGSASLSRNGRYALLRSSIVAPPDSFQVSLLDLQTGQETAYMGLWDPLGTKHRHEVADNGTVALANAQGFLIGQGGQVNNVAAQVATTQFSPGINPLINAAGSLVVYQAGGGMLGPARLSLYTVATGSSTDLATETANTPDFGASVSDDASVIVFLYGADRQVYVAGAAGAKPRQISNFSEPVTEVELSGDGTVAFAVTASNRIARINVATAQSTDVVPPTPYTAPSIPITFSPTFGSRFQVGRGGTISIQGSGFAADSQTAQPPFPQSLGGVTLQINGVAVPVAAVSPTSISYPVPWDLPNSPVDVEVWVSSASASPFVPGFEVETLAPRFVAAAHQDFLSLVSAASPPQPGEYIHAYAANVGPVAPAPPVGLAAPLQPLAQLAVPISCSVRIGSQQDVVAVDVTFAGLAPGLLDIFQIDVRMPDSFANGTPRILSCQADSPYVDYGFFGSLQ